MAAVAASSTAMAAVIASSTAMAAVIVSQPAVSALAANASAWAQVKNSAALTRHTTPNLPVTGYNLTVSAVNDNTRPASSVFDSNLVQGGVSGIWLSSASSMPSWLQLAMPIPIFVHSVNIIYGDKTYNGGTVLEIWAGNTEATLVKVATFAVPASGFLQTVDLKVAGKYNIWKYMSNGHSCLSDMRFVGFE